MMKDRLQYIFSLVNEWLKFGESKNAALLAADTALALGLVKMLQSSVLSNQIVILYVSISIPILALAAMVCLISFIPQTAIPWLSTSSRPKETDNLLFFGDIAKYAPKSYVEALYKQAEKAIDKVDAYEEDIAEQIIVNSRIALRKYKLFNTAIWLNVVTGLSPIGAILLFAIIKIARGKV